MHSLIRFLYPIPHDFVQPEYELHGPQRPLVTGEIFIRIYNLSSHFSNNKLSSSENQKRHKALLTFLLRSALGIFFSHFDDITFLNVQLHLLFNFEQE